MLLENKVDIGSIDEMTLFNIKETELILAGSNMTCTQAARRIMALLSQVPSGEEIETIFLRGLAAYGQAAEFEEPMEIIKPLFLKYLSNEGKAEATRKSYSTTLDNLGKILGNRPISEVSNVMIHELLDQLKDKQAQKVGVLGRCNRFLRWAQGHRYFRTGSELPTDHIKIILPRKMNSTIRVYPADVFVRIVDIVPETIRVAVILVATCLFRPEESYLMTYEQLFQYFDEGWIWTPPSVAKRVGTESASRWTPINPLAKKLLLPYRDRKGPLCPDFSTPQSATARFTEALALAKIKTVHDGVRKSCISAHAAIGVDMAKLAKWAGTSEAIINRYYKENSCTMAYFAEIAAKLFGVPENDQSINDFFTVILNTSPTPPTKLPPHDLIEKKRK